MARDMHTPLLYSCLQVTTVRMRGDLLDHLSDLRGAFWLPKDLLVFRKEPEAGSAEASAWQAAFKDLMAHKERIQW